MKKYYDILEVNKKASKEVIEKAYRVLAKKYHPDLYSGEKRLYAEQKMRDINEAYKILSDEFLREQYDLELEKEVQFDRQYTVSKNQNKVTRKHRDDEETGYNEIEETNNVGTLSGILGVTKALFENRPKIKNIKELKREDYIAAGLTLLIMIILLVILWFIPVTNGFVRSVLPFI